MSSGFPLVVARGESALTPRKFHFPANFNPGEGEVLKLNDTLRRGYEDAYWTLDHLKIWRSRMDYYDSFYEMSAKEAAKLSTELAKLYNSFYGYRKDVKKLGGEPFAMPYDLDKEICYILGWSPPPVPQPSTPTAAALPPPPLLPSSRPASATSASATSSTPPPLPPSSRPASATSASATSSTAPDAATASLLKDPSPDAATASLLKDPSPDAAPDPSPDAATASLLKDPSPDAALGSPLKDPSPDAAPASPVKDPSPDAAPASPLKADSPCAKRARLE